MRSRCGGGCCWRSKRPSAKPMPAQQRRLLTFVIVGGGPTGVELAGALAEIARQSLRAGLPPHPSGVGAHRAARGRPVRAGAVSRSAARRRAPLARAARRRGAHRIGRHRHRRRRRAAIGDASGISGRRRCCGRPASRRRRSRSRSACRSIAPAACTPSRRSRSPAHPEIFVVGDLCALRAGRQAAAGRGAGRDAAGHARRRRTSCARSPASRSSRSATRTTGSWRRSAAARRSATSSALKISGFFAWLFWIFLHIFWLIGFRNRFVVMTEWAWAYVTLQRRVRLITGDSDVAPPLARP